MVFPREASLAPARKRAYWSSPSHLSQNSVMPSAEGMRSLMAYLFCPMFTSGVTSQPGPAPVLGTWNEGESRGANL